MNALIFLGRKLLNIGRKVKPRYDKKDFISKIWRFLAFQVFTPFGRSVRSVGYQKYIYLPHAGSMGKELRYTLFRKLKIYVEGYLANISHRYFDDAPDPMPVDCETRKKWGQKMLRKLSEKHEDKTPPPVEMKYLYHNCKGDWKEICRIYQWMTFDWPNWNKPFWKKAPVPGEEEEISFDSDEDRKVFNEMAGRATRLDWIIEERIRGREKRLFERRHLLLYD